MRAAIESDRVPNLFVLHYSSEWRVLNLLLIPSFCFSVSALEKRKPLSPGARRAGWVGCNILLNAIPPDGRIKVVDNSSVIARSETRRQFNEIRSLKAVPAKLRGWALDVLSFARSLHKDSFTLRDMYAFEAQLSALYPRNNNVRPKIRQQPQVLRDPGILRFISPGKYEFTRQGTS
jgi:type II restriction enzyme